MGADVVQCPPMGGLCVKEKQEPAAFWKTFGLAALLWAALAAGSELLFPSSAAAPAGAAGLLRSCLVLPVAEELGLPFTLKELRNYELLKWGRQHQDRELTEQDMAVDYETTYWLLDRGWSNDEAAFCGGEH